jgi:hypothetical protein
MIGPDRKPQDSLGDGLRTTYGNDRDFQVQTEQQRASRSSGRAKGNQVLTAGQAAKIGLVDVMYTRSMI